MTGINARYRDTREAPNAQAYDDLRVLQADLIKMQKWIIENDKKVVIIFEGRDAAGKGGAIRRSAFSLLSSIEDLARIIHERS